MPSLVLIAGAENGVVATGAAPSPNERIWHTVITTGGTPGINTTTPKSGSRCYDFPATSGAESSLGRNLSGSPTVAVASFYIRFVGSLPTADCRLFHFTPATGSFPFLMFRSADSKLYASFGTVDGATGFSVSPDTWYLIDIRGDVSANPRTCDVNVNETPLGTASLAAAASSFSAFKIGKNTNTSTANGNIRVDDLLISQTSGDFPLGPHEVLPMALNADGTHSFTANDFIRGDAGAAILTSDTDVWTLVDEVPFAAIGTTDSVQQNVIRTTGYVELALEAAPRSVDAWAIQVHGQYDADGTGADSCTLKENDGGTLRDVYTNADVSNTSETFMTHCKATAPTGGAYTQSILDALKLRWGFSGDVTGSPILHAAMLEVAYPTLGDRRGVVTWAELETPNEPRRGVVTWAELETPNEPRRGIVTWAEFETPDPAVTDRRGVVTWAEFETPDEPRRGVVTWAEIEVPNVGEAPQGLGGSGKKRRADVVLAFRQAIEDARIKNAIKTAKRLSAKRTTKKIAARLADIVEEPAQQSVLSLDEQAELSRLRGRVNELEELTDLRGRDAALTEVVRLRTEQTTLKERLDSLQARMAATLDAMSQPTAHEINLEASLSQLQGRFQDVQALSAQEQTQNAETIQRLQAKERELIATLDEMRSAIEMLERQLRDDGQRLIVRRRH